ncbi:hypothetical protein EX30DRAFT_340351 [Ascodesmis nigricans]|uniref:Uncharacterized protein n=1 Tax=Ascodesmis nigricans TaxID=341454 RepID=A0A4S2MYY9_9PEZI|nr:hypothetical protein EX30DRAFT_340351 [Ascodesmis nigricans]
MVLPVFPLLHISPLRNTETPVMSRLQKTRARLDRAPPHQHWSWKSSTAASTPSSSPAVRAAHISTARCSTNAPFALSSTCVSAVPVPHPTRILSTDKNSTLSGRGGVSSLASSATRGATRTATRRAASEARFSIARAVMEETGRIAYAVYSEAGAVPMSSCCGVTTGGEMCWRVRC